MSTLADFSTTRWDLVISARDPSAREARDQFARSYWAPLYAFVRRRGLKPEDAADVVQGFLTHFLEGGAMDGLTESRGRLRTYLRAAMSNYLVSRHRADTARRRAPAGGWTEVDFAELESRVGGQLADAVTPERLFDRWCARVLLDAARERLQRDYETGGRRELFDHLSRFLDEDPDAETHAAAAARLGMDAGSVRNAVRAFRAGFQKHLRNQVAVTLGPGGDVDEELRHLVAALSE